MKLSKQITHGHGTDLDFDTHVANGSLRIAKTPSGRAYREVKGKKVFLKDDPNRFSYVTPENDEAKSWDEGTPEHYETARKGFIKDQKRKDFQDKLGQIKRSCPICRGMM